MNSSGHSVGEIRRVTVDFGSERWQRLYEEFYHFVHSAALHTHFPVPTDCGTATLEWVEIPVSQGATIAEMIAEIERLGYKQPCRAITESILDDWEQGVHPGITLKGLCGVQDENFYDKYPVIYTISGTEPEKRTVLEEALSTKMADIVRLIAVVRVVPQ